MESETAVFPTPEILPPGIKPILLLPSYNGWSRNRQAVVNAARSIPDLALVEVSSSCLGHCFNVGYQIARRNQKQEGFTHVVMLHADVVPVDGYWCTKMIKESLRVKADILSAIVPIKTQEGLTSTAFESEATQKGNAWHPVRLTMKEVMQLPVTFTHPRLMLNTGLMVIDLRKEWAHGLVFDIESKVNIDTFTPYYLPEDWKMSRYAQQHNASLWATRCIRVMHVGEAPFGNDKPWGTTASEGALDLYLKEGGTDVVSST